MVNDANWLLPEGVEEILPHEAIKLEMLRRSVLDDLSSRGFQLVMPPVMEFVDSLLTGTGEELDTQTYKFMDQHTHRMLGIRADITPQIARIDSHYLADQEVNRLCYVGTVLRTQPTQMGGQRELLQLGAEIFGVDTESADIEVIESMLAVLALSNAKGVTLSLGHVGIYRALLAKQGIEPALEQRLRDVLMRKSSPDLEDLESAAIDIGPFQTLLGLQGGAEIIDRAKQLLPLDVEIGESLQQIQTVVDHLEKSDFDINVHLDLADVFGYRYHTGLKFEAYVQGRGRTVAQGGRYDRIGKQFGRPRPATGFSADLKTLVKLA
jgi:ATP phosphoribosyltransferase regulatory subunit